MRNGGILGCFLACLVAPLAAEEYTVQRGDTLSTIADRELGRSSGWRELCEINNLPDCDRITAGMTLRLTLEANNADEVDAEYDAATSEQISRRSTESEQSQATGIALDEGDENTDVIFEEIYSLDSPLGLPFQTRRNHTISTSAKGVTLSGYVDDAVSTGRTDGAYIRVSDAFEKQASGRRIKVEITAYGADNGEFAAAYSTNEVGNSGWNRFHVNSEPSTVSFVFDAPPMREGFGDYLGIAPDLSNTGGAITVSKVKFIVLQE